MEGIMEWVNSFEKLAKADPADIEWHQLWTPSGFKYSYGKTPFTHVYFVIGGLIGYLLISFGLKFFMRNRPAMALTGVVVAHNAFLCVLSLAMCAGTAWAAYNIYLGFGMDAQETICDSPRTMIFGENTLMFWCYIFYLSKFYEMGDTFILALKKKPFTFLQMYHHAVIVVVVWSWMHGDWSGHWYCTFANTLVHIIMYYYFALSAMGYKIWWKKYLTGLQLVQFGTYVYAMFWWIIINSKLTKLDAFPFFRFEQLNICNGSWATVWLSVFVNFTMILLFGQFYLQTYSQKGRLSISGPEDSPASPSSSSKKPKAKKDD